jgi:hypothetical protein
VSEPTSMDASRVAFETEPERQYAKYSMLKFEARFGQRLASFFSSKAAWSFNSSIWRNPSSSELIAL